ncbi:SDR family NAD(P)-dependent oxidoreductase [Teredinibacter sp. KSP-S5-2]|uniref:SDR family NAD(P)-dependent oxidoreductase n=1 Tax=Teredinibacter sp. KSP-S5-2 TaxID=3034506 RepID=UPI002934E434|nr:SDR family NAD(P)-dependent oxidoreductase [Teredinibacter sp. KSP-S5-2]WNO11149.1 SDR family NAD(P)-dependent oxidoreductase [Teredinibacter sp. KSP-S5-2]
MNILASKKQVDIGSEEIAIIGMGCRFPNDITSPEEFWRSLLNQVDGISDVPVNRWDIRKYYDEDKEKPGKMYTKQAGFLKQNLETYDPLFFGISPREADVIDPMQRLLMEVTWETMEHAGIPLEEFQKVKTGVFVGGFAQDNKVIQLDSENQKIINATSAVGITLAMLSNRLSYVFDLTGPSLSIDTACSSSMVATHYAIQSLRNGDCEMAFVGGANAMLTPGYPVAMCKGQFLSHHSRCKAFSNEAAGYVRAEGAGVLLLKPLSKALEDGDRVHGVIIESGVNQDGGQTNGISQPNAKAQEKLIRYVYGKANIAPSDVSFIEAHGTGTKAGDPIEIKALTESMKERSLDNTCYVGSVKSNIGHMEAASAMAGIMKAALVAKTKSIPANLHFNTPNEAIPFDSIPLQVPTETIQLDKSKVHYIGVNSFGYGGTNGHVILRSPKENEDSIFVKKEGEVRSHWLVPVSAKSMDALQALAERYHDYVSSTPEFVMEDLIYSLSRRRTQLAERTVFVVKDKQDLSRKLLDYSKSNFNEDMVEAKAHQSGTKLCFVYTGMGPQWWAMGRELYASEPVFKAEVDKIESVFKKVNGWSILDEMMKPEDESNMASTTIAQPANFVIQAALTRLLEYWGVTPNCVIGHSVGEVSSAYISGAISLEDAVLVSCIRSQQQQRCANMGGGMLAVGMAEKEALALIKNYPNVAIAAINSLSAVTLSGDSSELELIATELTHQEIFNRFLRVDIAYHSSQMDPIMADLLAELSSLKPNSTHLPLYSTVTGELIDGEAVDGEYWCKNVREPVRFAQGIKSVTDSGDYHFIEIGPHPVLRASIKEFLDHHGITGSSIVSTLNRKLPELDCFYRTLAGLHANGIEIFWENYFDHNPQFLDLPLYPWQREHYWHETETSMEKRLGRAGYVYLNEQVRSPVPTWKMEVNKYLLPYLEDHKVEGLVVFPGAGYIDVALVMHDEQYQSTACSIENFAIHKMLAVQPGQVPVMRSSLDRESNEFRIYSSDEGSISDNWNLHVSGRVIDGKFHSTSPVVNIVDIKTKVSQALDTQKFYENMQARGLSYGHYFQPIKSLFVNSDCVLAEIIPVQELDSQPKDYLLHPTILDASFQSLITLINSNQAFVPVGFERLDFYRAPEGRCWSYGEITHRAGNSITCRVQLFNEQGETLAEIKNLTCQSIGQNSQQDEEQKWLYGFEWQASEIDFSDPSLKNNQQILVLANDNSLTESLVSELEYASLNYAVLYRGAKYRKIDLNTIIVDPLNVQQLEKAIAEFDYIKINTVIDLWSCESFAEVDATTDYLTEQSMSLRNMLDVLKSQTQKINWLKFTRGAQSMSSSTQQQNIAVAPLLGLGPLVINEFNHILCRMIDFDFDHGGNEPDIILSELADKSNETEVVYRDGARYLRKVTRRHADTSPYTIIESSTSTPAVAREVKRDGVATLELYDQPKLSVKKGQVEIAVKASLLNDNQLSLINQMKDAALPLFSDKQLAYECEGVVVAVGESSQFKVGDRVVAISGVEAAQTNLVIWQNYVALKPAGIHSFNPLWSTCAFYCLNNLGQLGQGDDILIHNADSYLGMYLIDFAVNMGANVHVTTVDESNKNLLENKHLGGVYDLDSLEYVEKLLDSTHRKGVRLVVNLASGSLRHNVFKVLSPFGRFIDLDVVANNANKTIPESVLAKQLNYHSVNLGQWLASQPDSVHECLTSSVSLCENNNLNVLMQSPYDASNVNDAYEYFQDGRARAEVVRIEYSDKRIPVNVVKRHTWLPRNGSFIVTGGTRGFGLSVALRLAELGAEQLILVSRSGIPGDSEEKIIDQIEQTGCKVIVEKTDICDQDSVANLVASYDQVAAPIKGIFHCAGVLDDGPLLSMTAERFNKVIKPKVKGAWNLHYATQSLKHSELALFVMFSSVSSMMGNQQQANYVVANSFFDNFAFYRRALGLPSTVINWGALSETGMVARDAGVKTVLEEQGIFGIANDYALQQMENALEQQLTQVGILDINWNAWFKSNPNSKNSPRYQYLIEGLATEGEEEGLNEFLISLKELSIQERQSSIENVIKEKISQLLRMPMDRIDSGSSLTNLGVDSIVTGELSGKLKKDYGLSVNSMTLLNSPSISALSFELVRMNFTEEDEMEAEPT